MKSKLLALCFAILPLGSFACTNLIVGKKASTTGAVMCTYSADSYGAFMKLYFSPAAKHNKGEMYQIYDYDTNKHWGEIPQVEETYNVVGHINEYQVSVMETTFGGREELADSTGLIDYGTLMYLALQRSKTAREALKVMTSLVEKYGYNSEGESFSVCDKDEAWILEMIGQGAGSKKVVWIAQRIPDNAISGHANQSRIRKVNLKDKANVMISKDCISFARKKGYFKGKDADFSFADAYAPADFSARRMCDARVWSWFNRHVKGMDKYLPWAEGKKKDAEPMPLWVTPDNKVSLQDVMDAMRDHYENTPLSLDDSEDVGGGIWETPYRPTPLYFEHDGKKYFNERPISTQQAGFSIISELRSWLPREIGAKLWFANDEANTTCYVPVYASMTKVPAEFDTPGADATHFSMDNAYWVCNWVANMVYPRYSMLFPELQKTRDALEKKFIAESEIIEKTLTGTPEKAATELAALSQKQASKMLNCWKELATRIIVKYNDMIIKQQDNKGNYLLTPEGLPQKVERPGYSEKLKKQIIQRMRNRYSAE